MDELTKRLNALVVRAERSGGRSFIIDAVIRAKVERVCSCISNRAPVRLLLSCMTAKLDSSKLDVRKPYTEIGAKDAFSGRTYDEQYLTRLIVEHDLPCNPTTAYLTPAFRNINRILTPDLELVGRPREVYVDALQLLNAVHQGRLGAELLFLELVRCLIIQRNEKKNRMNTLITSLRKMKVDSILSSEEIVNLVEQHLKCKNSSRLPTLIVAAAYKSVEKKLGERALELNTHNAADIQTGAFGDVEIAIVDDNEIVTVYEMKMRKVSIDDINHALKKIVSKPNQIDNYLFITTEPISDEVREYAQKIYAQTNGVEIAILDCIGFLRHFLHLFHRARMAFLDHYQAMVLSEPESAVSQPLKEAFLALRQSAQADE